MLCSRQYILKSGKFAILDETGQRQMWTYRVNWRE